MAMGNRAQAILCILSSISAHTLCETLGNAVIQCNIICYEATLSALVEIHGTMVKCYSLKAATYPVLMT